MASMPNKYRRKTDRGEASVEIYKLAAEDVRLRGKTYREAANSYNLNYSSLYRFIKKSKENQSPVSMGYVHNFVFNQNEEKTLGEYLSTCAAANYGLSTKEARRLAYELAQKYNKKCPASWNTNKMAGEVWLKLFMERHPDLSLRTPQATSLGRATSFNEANVKLFFNNYTELLDRYKFTASDIWNMDETGVTTVQKPNRVIARKGEKQISAMTSAERGTLVTLAVAVNAIGNNIPPMFVFPRKRYQDHFVRDGPIGSAVSGNASGWMQEDDFFKFLQHFKNCVRPSTEHKVLLLLDNHSSHVAVKNIQFCKDNGIILLTYPPHCTHKLQPLDRAVFGPLKKAINTAADSWMRIHPGKPMTIYDIPGLVKTAFDVSIIGRNITSGFSATGIWPLNPNIFTFNDFLPSQVTDRPLIEQPIINNDVQRVRENTPEIIPPAEFINIQVDEEVTSNKESQENPIAEVISSSINQIVAISESGEDNRSTCRENTSAFTSSSDVLPTGEDAIPIDEPIASTSSSVAGPSHQSPGKTFSPYFVRPLPKALPRKGTQNRRKVKSAILTDTPEKEALEAMEANRKLKNTKRKIFTESKQKKDLKKKKSANLIKKTAKATEVNTKDKRKASSDSDPEGEDCWCLCCLEPYNNSRPNEKWVQCMDCKGWSHEECTGGEAQYICQNCFSD